MLHKINLLNETNSTKLTPPLNTIFNYCFIFMGLHMLVKIELSLTNHFGTLLTLNSLNCIFWWNMPIVMKYKFFLFQETLWAFRTLIDIGYKIIALKTKIFHAFFFFVYQTQTFILLFNFVYNLFQRRILLLVAFHVNVAILNILIFNSLLLVFCQYIWYI